MSWMKQPQGAAAQPAPDPRHYSAPQPYGNQQNPYQNYSGNTVNAQQQYWHIAQQQQHQQQQQQQHQQQQPQQQAQFNQQYAQSYQQQNYGTNANPVCLPQQQYNQSVANQEHTNAQQGYQQSFYQQQGIQQQNYPQSHPTKDSWEDNWGDWGWEDSSKQAQNNTLLTAAPVQTGLPNTFNNANIIEESFISSTNTWKWSMEDKGKPKQSATSAHASTDATPYTIQQTTETVPTDMNLEEGDAHAQPHVDEGRTLNVDEVRTLNDKEAVKERLPNLALGKRFHLDNLTPQWSIESQMSQESSDGPQTHSESTYRSENQSRNSSKSSPGLNTESSNFNYSQTGLDELPQHNNEWSQYSNEDPTLADKFPSRSSRRESHDELSHSMQEMNISNKQNPTPDTIARNNCAMKPNDHLPHNIPPNSSSLSSASVPPAVSPDISSSSAAPVPPATSVISPSSSVPLHPPTNFPPLTSTQNPFKHSGIFSHKTTAKSTGMAPTNLSYPPQMSNTNLISPSAVNKASQHNRPTLSFGANLETTPDNSERPDQPQISSCRTVTVPQQVPDNLEIAPQNDRNEYLQTAHLSSGEYGDNNDFIRNIPPPGLRRLVVGQQESEYSQVMNNTSDEPPPGLARMVPGQQTETDVSYNQSAENYMDRHIDGRPTDSSGRPYRQADGQQLQDSYSQPPASRNCERRPIGLDRMVPGEPSNVEYSQFQSPNFVPTNDHRVVPGLDNEYSMSVDAGPSDIREQNMDGSDYTEHISRNPPRNIANARETASSGTPDFNTLPDDQQREITMEGENLQDLSVISSTELTFSREQIAHGANTNLSAGANSDRKNETSDSVEPPVNTSRRQSLNRTNTSGEDSERDRAFKSSPRRDRDKLRTPKDRNKDRDRDRDKDRDGRYSRDDRRYDRDTEKRTRGDRKNEKDKRDRNRRDREESPNAHSYRRSTRGNRYETEDTDYYSDRERERARSYREGSYFSSKPPRPDEKERRYHDERDRNRRYNTIERERYVRDDERERRRRRERPERYEAKYRDIDPSRKYGNLRMEREDEDRRRVVTFSGDSKASDDSRKEADYSSGSRPGSREAPPTDDDLHVRSSRRRKPRDPYYEGYVDPYLAQRRQYEYYEHLRLTDPAAYMRVYKQVMAGQPPPPPPPDYLASGAAPAPSARTLAHHPYGEGAGYMYGYGSRAEGRGSVHSGRSSAAALNTDPYYAPSSLRGAPSFRTDYSDRYTDLVTDASLHLEDSTVRSERMTPFKFSTAHVKASISSRHIVVVRPSYPVDGLPATVQLLSLQAATAHLPASAELAHYPGPLVKGVTHKKSVIEYCEARVRSVRGEQERGAARHDPVGSVLVWELLALMLRQNGVVVGTDIAELLMKNTKEYEHKPSSGRSTHQTESGRDSAGSGSEQHAQARAAESEDVSPLLEGLGGQRAALDTLREHLVYGNRHEAIEWAMRSGLWGHALQLAAHAERRVRAAVCARFLAALPPHDPLHTLYAALGNKLPPVVHAASTDADWRVHAAMLVSNGGARPDLERRTLATLGDTLAARALPHSAHFCYLAGGVPFTPHPLQPLPRDPPHPGSAPPRLALLLADSRAETLDTFATNEAIFATEIYEYALSLNQDYVIPELQAYKLLLATRLVDCGQYERALQYAEQAARAVTRTPHLYSPRLPAALAALADRLKYHDPALLEEPALGAEGVEGDSGSGEPSPRHQQWLDDVKHVALMLKSQSQGVSSTGTPQHEPAAPAAPAAPLAAPTAYDQQQYQYQSQYQHEHQQWTDQTQQQQYQPVPMYGGSQQQHEEGGHPPDADAPPYHEWGRALEERAAPAPAPAPAADEHDNTVYWGNNSHYGYGESGDGGEESRPSITMPGARVAHSAHDNQDTDAAGDDDAHNDEKADRDAEPPASGAGSAGSGAGKPRREEGGGGKGGGWLGNLLSKLRPPNQMNLPDDKNPTIVWDAARSRWRDLGEGEGEGGEESRAPPPPPQHIAHNKLTSSPLPLLSPAGAPSAANMLRMQKGRQIKKSYVDVFNGPGGAGGAGASPAAAPVPPAPLAPPPLHTAPTYFIPTGQVQVDVTIPSSSSSDAQQPSPTPFLIPTPTESGVYDPTQVEGDDPRRSAI